MKLEWGQITISSIFSLLLGIIIGHWLAIKRDKRKEFIEAGKEFREAFLELQSDLHLGPQNTWKLISKHHQEAVKAKIQFEPVLPLEKGLPSRKHGMKSGM